MDTKGNLYIYNRDGSLREVIPPDQVAEQAQREMLRGIRRDIDLAVLCGAETPAAAAEERIAEHGEVVLQNRHERRKAAALARRKKSGLMRHE